MGSPTHLALACLLATSLLSGCSDGDRDTESRGGGRLFDRIDYRAEADSPSQVLVDREGLVLTAACPSYGRGKPSLSVTARTRVDDARAEVVFQLGSGGKPRQYRFDRDDLDRDADAWDLFGAVSGRVDGAITYRPPKGERLIVALHGGGGSGCRLRGTLRSDRLRAGEGPVPKPKPIVPGEGELDQCKLGPLGGGYDVWIRGIGCNSARRWVLRLVPTHRAYSTGPREGIGRLEGRWECWSKLEDRYGPFHNVCLRGKQLIMFYFA